MMTGTMRRLLIAWPIVCVIAAGWPMAASAQQADSSGWIVVGEVAYARTWDDEGLLGAGMAVMGGAGYRVSERWSVRGVVRRVPYGFNRDYLTIDGSFLFYGVEAVLQANRPTFRPFWSIGGGQYNDDSVWTYHSSQGPFQPRVDERTEHHYTLMAITTSGGLDVKVSDRLSILASVRFIGLKQTGFGRDLAPHTSIQPGLGVAWRF